MNPFFVKIGVGIGMGVLFSAAALLILLFRSANAPHYAHEFTGSFTFDTTAAYVCCICLEDMDSGTDNNKVFILPCGHKFHRQCLKIWFAEQGNSRSCPYCRRHIDENVSQCL